ncbi:ANTAR domain-containing protein [Kribbella amoyensis]|uniref:ANTAR domain-containing protein n=2 Tax=Kribbella amoyensis TaxID=996641 RepID=A0A561BRI1_9ACTN|nr:GAF and ANTAR domain-containing protein [Kribbella amoyensis]TWD81363.1 ANTAR domain-containing protein [Kribbella amoyensis]
MPGAAGSVLLCHRRRLVPTAASDPELLAADRAQAEYDEGPSVDVLKGTAAAFAADLRTAPAWPVWAPRAVELGWRTMLSLRLTSRAGHLLGVFTVAHTEPGVLGPAVAEHALTLATHLSVGLDTARIQENLRLAQDAQARVGQATGILMERFGLDADQAFRVLRRYSQDTHRKLHLVAEEVISNGGLPAAPAELGRSGWRV